MQNTEKPLLERIKRWYRRLPDKKRYLEFITALLTIPVLLTVTVSNILNLQSRNQTPTPVITQIITPQSTPQPTIQPSVTATIIPTSTPTPSPSAQCKKEIGQVTIADPDENAVVTSDPVCLDIVREGADYCAVVWSYRINGSAWSEYTDKSICMYGLTDGVKNLELRIKSIVTGAETILKRTFIIPSPTPTITPTPTP